MSPYTNHMINDTHDDDGWGFYVVLDIEDSFINIISLQKQYTRTVSGLPTIDERNEHVELKVVDHNNCTNDTKINLNSEHARIYLICMISCLYVWILLTS